MISDRNTPWTALVVLSALAAWGLWSLATHEPNPQPARILDLPPVAEAALLTSGIDRQTLNDYLAQTSVEVSHGPVTAYASQLSPEDLATRHSALATPKEVKPAPGRTKPSSPAKHLVQTARGTTLSRAPKIGEWVKVEISTYSARYHGRRTATGERYDHHRGFTAATTRRANGWDLPRGSTWEVNYRGKTVVVRINDCGRHRPTKARLWLDLSGAAWRDLTGIAPSRKVARMRRVK